MHKNNIFYLCQGGIGNRLKYFASLYEYYKPQKFTLVWKKKGWVTASFSELFQFESKAEMIELYSEKDVKKYKKLFKSECLYKQGYHWKLYAKEDIDLKYNDISEENRKLYLDFFNKLKPSAQVKKRIKDIDLPRGTVALQVRNNLDWEKAGRNENLEDFVKQMQKFPQNTMFFLSAMSSKVSDYFKSQFPDRIIELPNKNYSLMIDAVADIFLLSRCQNGIYSYGSTFAEVAWWIGGAKAQVSVVGNEKNWKKDHKNFIVKNLIRLLFNKLKRKICAK